MQNRPERILLALSRLRRYHVRPTLCCCLLALAASSVGAQAPPAAPQSSPPAKANQTPPPAQPAPAPAKPAAPAQPPATPQLVLPPTAEFRKGVLYGRVLDLDGKPVADATVALQEKAGKVLTWTKTNAQGEYALAADPMTALRLRPSARRGLLEQCARAVGDVVMAPVKVAGSAVANPGKTIKSAAVSVATGTPAPLIGQTIVPALGDKSLPNETAKQARDVAAKTAVGEGPAPKGKQQPVDKGEALLMVSAPGFKEGRVKAGAYWMECPCTEKDKQLGMQAWLETVKLAPATGDKSCDVVKEALTLTTPVLEPTLVPAGGVVKIKVTLQSPPGPDHKVRVFAREARKDVVVELMPQEGADKNVFAGTLALDPKTPAGETVVSIAALRAEPVEVKLNAKKADPLQEFVRRLDDMRADRPYGYDPRIMASENRLDIKLTVLDAKQGTTAAQPAAPDTAGKK